MSRADQKWSDHAQQEMTDVRVATRVPRYIRIHLRNLQSCFGEPQSEMRRPIKCYSQCTISPFARVCFRLASKQSETCALNHHLVRRGLAIPTLFNAGGAGRSFIGGAGSGPVGGGCRRESAALPNGFLFITEPLLLVLGGNIGR